MAWQQGAFEYHKRKRENTLNVIDIRKSQETYRPGSVETLRGFPFKEERVNDLLKADLEQYNLMIQQLVFGQTGKLEMAQDYYNAGVLYLEYSRLSEALELIQEALKRKPEFPDAHNTLGVVYTRMGIYDKALAQYDRALEGVPDHPGYKLNVAITHFLQGKKLQARREYEEVVSLDPAFAGELNALLGLKRAPQRRFPKTLRGQLRKLPGSN